LGVRYALLLSEDALSTTKTSASICCVALPTEQRHCSRKYCTL
jgi:hypothetical protein